MTLDIPLMSNNITMQDRKKLIQFLETDSILTQSAQVRAFEAEWSKWLGMKYSVFVNSGSSANVLTMAAFSYVYGGGGEVIVPTLTWVSDISSVIQAGFKPVFVDIDKNHLGMQLEDVKKKVTSQTRAVFLTHVLGFNALSNELLDFLKQGNIPLIEDVCESHGASFEGKKAGTFGAISNFSFYYAHHLSTIEGGMVCTNDEKIYQAVRMGRSHGMVRESDSAEQRTGLINENPELNPDFIFAYPAYNMRSTELNAVLGLSQLPRLDSNNAKRTRNFSTFLKNLDPNLYRTDFAVEGSVNYAFTLVLKEPNQALAAAVVKTLREAKVEFRRGLSGGGNQLRQPYLSQLVPRDHHKEFPNVEHVHFFGWYIGNFPDLPEAKVVELCKLLNTVKVR